MIKGEIAMDEAESRFITDLIIQSIDFTEKTINESKN